MNSSWITAPKESPKNENVSFNLNVERRPTIKGNSIKNLVQNFEKVYSNIANFLDYCKWEQWTSIYEEYY